MFITQFICIDVFLHLNVVVRINLYTCVQGISMLTCIYILNEINAPYTSLLFLDYNPTRIPNKPFVILRLKIKTYFSNRKCCFLFIKVILYAQFWVDFSNYANRYSRSGAFLSMNIIINFMHFNGEFIKSLTI